MQCCNGTPLVASFREAKQVFLLMWVRQVKKEEGQNGFHFADNTSFNSRQLRKKHTLHGNPSGIFFLRACSVSRIRLKRRKIKKAKPRSIRWFEKLRQQQCKKLHTFLPGGTFLDSPRRVSELRQNGSRRETPTGPQACCLAISYPRATVPEPRATVTNFEKARRDFIQSSHRRPD